ncbi:MAG: pyridoxamine 5'-phosphate oxidase family protein [Clostridia bacterium]|nr:pyridoxamine 5'-phosphate oxidase family protein [Clostridia bacterium]
MRRKDREMSKEFALQVVDKCEWATLATITPNNTPYCVTLSIARIENSIYFHCAKDGKKIDCFKRFPDVCISCVGDTCRLQDEFATKYESAIIFGKVSQVTDREEKILALKAISERHTPANMKNFDDVIQKSLSVTDVWKVAIDSISGKSKR